jgi:hypothetical protein
VVVTAKVDKDVHGAVQGEAHMGQEVQEGQAVAKM